MEVNNNYVKFIPLIFFIVVSIVLAKICFSSIAINWANTSD